MAFTTGIRSILRAVVHKYNIESIVDMPCGAMEWMPHVLELLNEDQPGFRYGCLLGGLFSSGLGWVCVPPPGLPPPLDFPHTGLIRHVPLLSAVSHPQVWGCWFSNRPLKEMQISGHVAGESL